MKLRQLEQRIAAAEKALDGYVAMRGERALERSKLPSPQKKKKGNSSRGITQEPDGSDEEDV